MKKWLLIMSVAALGVYLLVPTALNFVGVHTTRVMLFNGDQEKVAFRLNSITLELMPGEVQVLRTSCFRNKLRYELDGEHYKLHFGVGQHIVNLGDSPLHVKEMYYHWNEGKQAFFTRDSQPNNRLLLDRDISRGVQTIDNCWSCCLLLPPGERPYKYLTPANKEKRFFVTSLM